MKKAYTTFCLCWLACVYLQGQSTYFNKMLLTSFAEQSVGVVEHDSGYWLYGHQMDSNTSKQVVFLYKTDYQGNLFQKSSWGDSLKTFSTVLKCGITATNDHCLAAVGSIVDSSSVYGFLMKIKANGDTIWSKHLIDTISTIPGSWLAVRNVHQTLDSGYIIGAQIYGNLPQETRCMLIKTDSLGNMQWFKTYVFTNDEAQPYDLLLTPDGGYLVVGYKYDGYDYDGWILKTDKYGTLQWQKVLGGQYDDFINAACITPDGNIVVVLNDGFQDVGYQISQMQVIKYSMAGTVIWNKLFYYNRSITCKSIVALDDNSLALIGYNYVIDTILQKYAEPSYIFKLNPQGDSVWFRHFIYHSSNPNVLDYMNKSTAIDMISTSDGGFLVCGDYIQYPPNLVPQSSWIVKLDSLGCDTPGCQFISIEERVLSIQELEVFPNPFSEIMHVVLPEGYSGGKLVLYDVQGRKAAETEVPANWWQQNFALKTNLMNPGIYLVELTDRDGRVWRRKAVKK